MPPPAADRSRSRPRGRHRRRAGDRLTLLSPPGADRRYPAHRAGNLSEHSIGRIVFVALRNLGLMAMAAVTAAGVVLFVHAIAGDDPLFASATVRRASVAPPLDWVERVATKVLPSVVTLQVNDTDTPALGSGVILDADGLILTNDHVVAGLTRGGSDTARTLVVLTDGRTAAFDVIATDPRNDIAVVRARNLSGLTAISLGSSAELRIGQPVVAVGSPLGLDGTVTDGIVSALNRPVIRRLATDDGWTAFDGIQTDAAINPGNSGGALVDTSGRLIGINAAEAVLGNAESTGAAPHGSIGLGFAIPVENAIRIANELIATGRASHAWLGVQARSDIGTPGARIVDVTADSPAAAAGLTPGALITQVDHQLVESGGALIAAIQSRPPGVSASLVVTEPSGARKTIAVPLGSDEGRD
jgi:putative serine protease PepD